VSVLAGLNETLVNSGLVPLGPGPTAPFMVTFPNAGSYSYGCVIHPLMTGTVKVVDAGGEVETQAQITSRADTEQARWLDEGRAAKRTLNQAPPRSERGVPPVPWTGRVRCRGRR